MKKTEDGTGAANFVGVGKEEIRNLGEQQSVSKTIEVLLSQREESPN